MRTNPFEAPAAPHPGAPVPLEDLVEATLRWQRAAIVLVVGWSLGSVVVVEGGALWRMATVAASLSLVLAPTAYAAIAAVGAGVFARSVRTRMAQVETASERLAPAGWVALEYRRWRAGVSLGLVLLTLLGAMGMVAAAVLLG